MAEELVRRVHAEVLGRVCGRGALANAPGECLQTHPRGSVSVCKRSQQVPFTPVGTIFTG
eukprot:5788029-Prymnesium_polylepis.2